MGQVPIITQWREAVPYLEGLKTTVQRDIRPLLETQGAAPFAIGREVMSYVDHMGHLYSGSDNVAARFKEYMEHILSKADPNYAKRAAEIYQMYRCGPVHEFEPKVLENKKGQLLRWCCYKGNRSDEIEIAAQKVKVKHLEAVNPAGDKNYWLPVSTPCLIEDLICSINQFAQAGPEDERITAWNRAARELNCSQPFNFVVP